VFAVEVTFEFDQNGVRSRYERKETPEEAAQCFESEAGTPPCDLSLLVEELALGKKLEEFDEETGKLVVAFELVGAVV
jgi:hypothetical protein